MATMDGDAKPPVLAVDIGGTKILAALVAPGGTVLARERRETGAKQGPETVNGRILEAIDSLLASSGMAPGDLYGISLAAAGAVDVRRRVVSMSPSLPGWQDIPLGDIVEARFGSRTLLLNDASAAAVGEHRLGAGKGARNLVYVTASTGIGGGIIIDSCLYEGPSGSAGEIGHMVIDVDGRACSCGGVGCLETVASGAALAREARHRLEDGEASILADLAGGDPSAVSAELVGLAAGQGDALSLAAVRRAGRYLGAGLANVVNILNPEVIVVGGGLSRMGDLLLEPAREAVEELAFRLAVRSARIVAAELGDDAGVVGAAAVARDRWPPLLTPK